jgi:hypothetical protein
MQYALPIIVALLTAKFIGDLLTHGFYEIVLHFKKFPYLGWEPPHEFMQVCLWRPCFFFSLSICLSLFFSFPSFVS